MKWMSPPEAYREIERLRLRVQELEKKLEQERNNNRNNGTVHRQPTDALSNDYEQHASLTAAATGSGGPRRGQNGIYIPTGRSGTETWYGDSSLSRFIGRISSFLTSPASRTHDAEERLNPGSPRTLLDEPPRGDDHDNLRHEELDEMHTIASDSEISLGRDFLSPMHEEHFLGLYWASYHTSVFPILNEVQFKQHYWSLCSPQGNDRLPSALVDIVIAICIQMGTSSMSRQVLAASYTGAAVPGRQYYLRSQQLLAYELENPTLSTLQCQILSSVYLCAATFHNMSDSTCAAAVRTAYVLGLHTDPPDSTSVQEGELRKRLWWALFIMDSKIGIKYGRPFFLHWTTAAPPRLPEDDTEAAVRAGSELTPLGDNLSWLSFHREHARLFSVARSTYLRCCNLDSERDELASQAEALRSCVKDMEAWAAGVPHALQTKRVNTGRSFSTDTSDLSIDPFSPLWLQRQRLLLELMYHNLCISLYRPYVQFGQDPSSDAAKEMAMKCVSHSIALSRILHQVLISTSILTGWHEAFQWQWGAAMTLAGFVLACPRCDYTPAARDSLREAVANLDDFGGSIAVAASAAKVVRKIEGKIDELFRHDVDVQQRTSAADRTPDTAVVGSGVEIPYLVTPDSTDPGEAGFRFDEMADLSFQDVLNMASGVDQYAEPFMLWNNLGDFGAQ